MTEKRGGKKLKKNVVTLARKNMQKEMNYLKKTKNKKRIGLKR